MNIVLSGPPFSGKTTIGNELAQLLKCSFVDTDILLEETFGMPCSEQHSIYGIETFRKNELLVLQKIAKEDEGKVIALGGGTLTYSDNVAIAKSLGTLVRLHCSFEELYSRLIKSGRNPTYLDANNLESSFKTLLKEREVHYREHYDLMIDVTGMSPMEAAHAILDLNSSL